MLTTESKVIYTISQNFNATEGEKTEMINIKIGAQHERYVQELMMMMIMMIMMMTAMMAMMTTTTMMAIMTMMIMRLDSLFSTGPDR